MLEASFRVARGELTVAIDLDVGDGEVLALLGPNASGKTTTLSVIAGLVAPDEGRVRLGGVALTDTSAGIAVPAARRGIGVVFQDVLLFPHLDVRDNVAFGRRAAGVHRVAARDEATRLLTDAGLADIADRRPAEISGGQAQRVALLRALAARPSALLLDEPLAALDAAARTEVRAELRRRVRGFGGPIVLVTHDLVDAATLADRVAVLDRGRVAQVGTVAEVTAAPRTEHAAHLLGVTLLRGTIPHPTSHARSVEPGATPTLLLAQQNAGESGTVLVNVGGATIVAADGGNLGTVDAGTGSDPLPVLVLIRPAAVALHRAEPDTSARNRWPVRVLALDALGDRVRLHLDGPPDLMADVTPAAVSALEIDVGRRLWASVKATDVDVRPA